MAQSNFRGDIEGLRAIAVLSVVAFHFGVPAVAGGFIGVDIFFVISGYLITGLLANEIQQTGTINFLNFYGRRARRLLPAALLVTLVTLLSGFLIVAPHEQKLMAEAGLASSLYLSNFWFVHQIFDYFAPEATQNPFLHTWSLAVEEQFYLFWPLIILLGSKSKTRLPVILALLAVASFCLCVWLTETRPKWAFYGLPPRAWEFAIGGFFSLRRISPRLQSLSAWSGLCLIAFSLFYVNDSFDFPGFVAMLPVFGTILVLISGGPGTSGTFILNNPVLRWIGQLSYSIYLWHWPIITFAKVLNPDIGPINRIGCFFLTVIVSQISFTTLEKPIRSSKWLIANQRRSIIMGLSLTTCSALFSFFILISALHFLSSPFQAKLEAETELDAIGRKNGCLLNFADATPIACSFGDKDAKRTIVLFGDSHADQWSTSIADWALRSHLRALFYLKGACPVIDIPVYNERMHQVNHECAEWRSAAMDRILKLKPEVVIISQASVSYIGQSSVTPKDWELALQKVSRQFRDAGIEIVVLGDTPAPPRNIKDCLGRADWFSTPEKNCGFSRSPIDVAVAVEESSTNGATRLDFTKWFCDDDCNPIRDNIIVYRDSSHITVEYSLHLQKQLDSALNEIMHPQ